MRHIADLTDFEAFKQAVGQHASDRAALKAIKSALMDKKTEIELKMDSPLVDSDPFAAWEKRLVAARDWTVRKMNHVDSFLSKTKVGEVVGWIMWVVYMDDDGKWMRTSLHPVPWLVRETKKLANPNDIFLSHFFPVTQEQWDEASNMEIA